MANNRIYLKCNKCDSLFAILKWYPNTGWFTNRENNDSLNEWADVHSHNESPFSLTYEHKGEQNECNA